jgi:ABC-type glycerol-3-phosphate transport system substrate-binding protein
MWAYGAQLADENGNPTFNSTGTVEALKLVKTQFVDLKIVPPDSLGATVTSWNNEAYQKRRALAIVNPTTVYGWLAVNDPKLLEQTGLYALPAGPAGTFTECDVWQFGVFKKSKDPEKAVEALAYFMEPERYRRVTSAVEGRLPRSRASR